MFRKDYIISGITLETANKWYKETKGDLQFYINRKTGEAYIKRSLTSLGALITRIELIKYNLTHPCVLKLKKYKGRRYRV